MAEGGVQSGRLTDSFIASSDALFDLFCEVCADDNKHLEAEGFCVECREYLCGECVVAHGRSRLSRNHVVHNKSQMPRKKPPPIQPKPATGSCSESCDQHPDRMVEYYCSDDESLCCSVCLLNHRQCRTVDHISDLSKHLMDSQEYHQFNYLLKALNTQSQAVINDSTDNILQAEKLCLNVTLPIQELRRQAMDAFDYVEDEMQKKADIIKSADVKKLKVMDDNAKAILDEVTKISGELHTLQSKDKLGQLFVRIIKLRDKVQIYHKTLDDAELNNNVTTYVFKVGTCMRDILEEPSAIGQTFVKSHVPTKSAPKPLPAVPLQKISTLLSISKGKVFYGQAERINDITARTKSDNYKCSLIGSALLPSVKCNKMVLTDYENKLKLLDLEISKVTSEMYLSSGPWDVTDITGNLLAATLREVKKILFVNVTSEYHSDKDMEVLLPEREMAVNGKCMAIQHYNGKLIVAFCEPLKIEIMALDGTVEKRIQRMNLFKWPSHIALSQDHEYIYVADFSDGNVKKISMSGAMDAEYRDGQLSQPSAVIVDQQGRVLVCGASSNNVQLLTANLTKLKVLVEDLNWPQSICLCQSTRKLYVGSEDEDSLRVYKLP